MVEESQYYTGYLYCMIFFMESKLNLVCWIKKMDRAKWIKIAIHIIGWLLLLMSFHLMRMNAPFLFELPWVLKVRQYLTILLLIVIFYVNYSFLIPKLFSKKKFISYIISCILLIFSGLFLHQTLDLLLNTDEVFRELLIENRENYFSDKLDTTQISRERLPGQFGTNRPRIRPRNDVRPGSKFFDFFTAVSLTFMLLIGTGIKFGENWFENERQREEMEKEKLQTELTFLKNQINPHFFFNMLNNIYSFTQSDPPKAQEAIHKLSKLMRYMLYESARELVSLEREIAFMKNYIEMAKIRVSKSNRISFEHHEDNPEVLIPPLLFLPFLENIFKHGIRQNEPSEIEISLEQMGSVIYFYAKNDIFKADSTTEDKGIGLQNVRRRLDLLFGNNYSLDITEENNEFKVGLTIPVDET